MQVQKTFRHPLHFVNYVRKCMRQELAKVPVEDKPKAVIPIIHKEQSYYFCFETKVDDANNEVRWALVSFDSDGVVLFSDKGKFWCGPWHWRRQGIASMSARIQGVVVNSFRKRWYPINKEYPFAIIGEGLYQVQWNWAVYRMNLKAYSHV